MSGNLSNLATSNLIFGSVLYSFSSLKNDPENAGDIQSICFDTQLQSMLYSSHSANRRVIGNDFKDIFIDEFSENFRMMMEHSH